MPLKRKPTSTDDVSSKRHVNIHFQQAQFILSDCVFAPVPCDHCVEHFEACAMSSNKAFTKCVACTRLGIACRHSLSSLRSWTAVVDGQHQLDIDIQAAELEYENLIAESQRKTSEAYSHLKSLRARRQFLKTRGDLMLVADYQPQNQVDTSAGPNLAAPQDSTSVSDTPVDAAPPTSPSPDPALALDQALTTLSPGLVALFDDFRTPEPSLGN
jgi:hypothetical protein